MSSTRTVLGAASVALATTAALVVLPSASFAAPSGIMVAAKKDRGSLRVVAQNVPQGRSAKITVAGKQYARKLPATGKLRNLRPGTYRVWATPIVTDGGTSAVPNLPVKVRVSKRQSASVALQYQWNPKADSFPPGPATGLSVSDVGASTASLRWVNSAAPDLAAVAIARKQGSVAPASLDDGKVVSVAPGATTVTDTGLQHFTTYSYTVFLVDASGNVSPGISTTVTTRGQALDLVSGTSHTCALLGDQTTGSTGQVACWGANDRGQLGIGTTDASVKPVLVDIDNVVQLAAGGDHTCARLRDNSLSCWGANHRGQLGNGTTDDSTVPVSVALSAPSATISAGGDHTCAVSASGGLRCWGDNEFAQSGRPASDDPLTSAPSLPLLNAVSAVAAGWSHTCVILRTGAARCFGANGHGQLGNNSTDDSSTPVVIQRLPSQISAISAGVGHTCAVSADASLYCWGANAQGQIGDGSTTDRKTAVQIAGTFSAVTAGAYHTCSMSDAGLARCWGRNNSGRLGDGTVVDRLVPTRVLLGTPVSRIAAGGHHSCAVLSTDTYCWGSNGFGQLGSGLGVTSPRPLAVEGL